jgi:hypothetical protein
LLITFKEGNNKNNELITSKKKPVNSSVAIASAIASYARIFMSQFKNTSEYIIYYTDTDSFYVNKRFLDELIGTKLGQFKLEAVIKEAVFVAPKLYGCITIDGEEISKVKGYKHHVPFGLLKSLLHKNNIIKLEQEKWFKNMYQSSIKIENQEYNITATQNKRELIYKNEKLVGTRPFRLEDGKIVPYNSAACNNVNSGAGNKDE